MSLQVKLHWKRVFRQSWLVFLVALAACGEITHAKELEQHLEKMVATYLLNKDLHICGVQCFTSACCPSNSCHARACTKLSIFIFGFNWSVSKICVALSG